MSLLNFYFDIVKEYKNKYENCLVLMEVGTFYEVYSITLGGGDVDIVSNVCEIEKTRTNKKIINNKDDNVNINNPYMCGFQSKSLNEYIQLLINKNYNIVLVKQKLVDNKITRVVDSIITKSTFLTNDVKTNNILLAIYHTNDVNYYCSIDLSTGINNIYTDDNNYINILNPIEILCISNLQLTLNTNIKINNKKLNIEFTKNIIQNTFLNNIFNFNNLLSPIENLNLEKYPNHIICYIEMLNYIKNINNNLIYKIQKPIINNGKILKLTNNTITQLNLLSNDTNNYKYNSIYDLLNNCNTNMGSRLLKYRLLNPIYNVKILNNRYKTIKNLLIDDTYVKYNNLLINLIDTTKFIKKLLLKTISPNQIYNLYNSYINIQKIINLPFDICKNYLNKNLIINFNYLLNLFEYHFNINNCKSCKEFINIFNVENHKNINELYIQYDLQINELQILQSNLNKILNEENAIKLEYNEKEQYYFTTTNKKIQILQKSIKTSDCLLNLNIKNLKSYSKFTTDQLNVINNNINNLKIKIKELYDIKYNDILNELNEFSTIMNYIDEYISNVDLYCGIAKSSILYNLKPPTINVKNSNITGNNIRHPLIEILNTKLKYVGNDINLTKGMLIYGINFSGKSSYLRSIGINIILAQSGFYIGADNFTYKPFTNLYTKIALQDNLFNEKSLFINEMVEIKNIIDNSNSNTLVLADELFSGTEPKSAIALASSVINTLHNKNVKFIFTSHYHDLLKIKEISEYYIPYYFKVDILPDGKMIFTRKLVEGITQSEYGIEVAKHIGINDDFINFALNIRNNLQSTTNTLKVSKYNSNLLVDTCKVCHSDNNLHTHHIIYQKYFKNNNSIVNNKNNLNNLIILCEDCHIKLHKNLININEYIQTSDGIEYK